MWRRSKLPPCVLLLIGREGRLVCSKRVGAFIFRHTLIDLCRRRELCVIGHHRLRYFWLNSMVWHLLTGVASQTLDLLEDKVHHPLEENKAIF